VSAENPTFGCILLPFLGAVAKLIGFQNIKKEEQIDTSLIFFVQEQDTPLVKLRMGGKVCNDVDVPCSCCMFFLSILCKLDTTSAP
jgi:hypothetical protein